MRKLACGLLIILLARCTLSKVAPAAPSTSFWGNISTLGHAEQTDAPALVAMGDDLTAAWIGSDDSGIHQDMLQVNSTDLPPATVLPLPPVHPYAQQLAPAANGNIHLFWLDAGDSGETRLFTALITPEQTVERGPTQVSDRRTARYALMSNGDGTLWAVWSGGLLSEPALYAQYIDADGRPREPQPLVSDADWLEITYTGAGTQILFWLQASNSRPHVARFVNGALADIQPAADAVALNGGDLLTSFRAGLDHTHAYLFWNLTRANGQPETWVSSSPLAAPVWSAPQRLGVEWTTKSFFETGFNGGRAYPAHSGERWLSWSAPVAGQLETLPVAAAYGSNLGLVYFRDGDIIGYQNIVTIAGLIGTPFLLTDRDLHLYLAWSEPTPNGYADLKLTMTRK